MKYLIIKNINLIKEKLLKFYLAQLVMVILALIIDYSVIPLLKIEDSYNYLGLNKLEANGILEILIKLVSLLIVIYITTRIYLREINSSTEYTALRLNKYKWSAYNTISCIAFILLMRIIIIVITYSAFYLGNHSLYIGFLFNVLSKDMLYYIAISMITMNIMNLVSNNLIGKLFGTLLLLFLVFLLKIDIISIPVGMLVLAVVIMSIINIISFNPIKVSNVFKRS